MSRGRNSGRSKRQINSNNSSQNGFNWQNSKTTKGTFLIERCADVCLEVLTWTLRKKNTPPEILNVRAAVLTISSNLASPAYPRPYFTCMTWHNVAEHLLPGWRLAAALFLRSLVFQWCLFKPTKLPNLLMCCSFTTRKHPRRLGPRQRRPIPHKRRRMWVW